MTNEEKMREVLLWIIYEQCVYGGKAYAKLLTHGQEAFEALGLQDGCLAVEIEKFLFHMD